MGSKAELSSKPDEIAGRVIIGAFAARVLVSVLAAIQLGLGAVGLVGIYLYIAEAKVNPERDEMLLIPFGVFYGSAPFLLGTAILYRWCREQLSVAERWLVHVGCALPVVAFASVFVFGYEGRWSGLLMTLFCGTTLSGAAVAGALSLTSLQRKDELRFSLRAAFVTMTALAVIAALLGFVMRGR